MNSRPRYHPPGMGGGRGGGMNPYGGLNPNFQPTNANQQHVQRSPAPNNQHQKLFQNPQPQPRNQLPTAAQSDAVDSTSRMLQLLKEMSLKTTF